MKRRRFFAVVAFSSLAACGSGGGGSPSGGGNNANFIVTTGSVLSWDDGECTGLDNTFGDFYSLSPTAIANLQAKIASTGQVVIGISTFGNGLVMQVTRPPPTMVVPSNTTVLSIDNLPQVTRQKSVRPRNFHTNLMATLTKDSTVPGAISMTIDRQSCGSGFLNVGLHGVDWAGVWHQFGEFDPDTFWDLAGGNLVTFLWKVD